MLKRIRSWTSRRAHYGPVSAVDVPKSAPDGEAVYVGTTIGGSAHQKVGGALFGRGECRYWLQGGALTFQRGGGGGPGLQARSGPAIALTGITEVGLSGAHAGQVMAPNRIAIVTWRLGQDEVDTGFGFDNPIQAEAFADRVAAVAGLSPDKGPHASA
ncbi:MAG: hypothetical protein ACRDYA_06065 [Egibacteraceae bacterium]